LKLVNHIWLKMIVVTYGSINRETGSPDGARARCMVRKNLRLKTWSAVVKSYDIRGRKPFGGLHRAVSVTALQGE